MFIKKILLTSSLGLISAVNLLPAQERIDVAIVATRAEQPTLETPGTTIVLDSDRMARSGSESLQEVLRYEPGISVPFDFAAGDGLVPYLAGGAQSINIRGIEGNRVALQLDGIRQPEDFVTQAFLDAGGPGRVYFDPSILEQLEIFKGASSSLYGSDALGGTVSGRTVSPTGMLGSGLEGRRLDNSLSFSSLNNSINNRFAAAIGDGRLAASVVYSFRDGNERKNNGDSAVNPADFTSHAIVATGVARLGAWDLSLTLDYFNFDQFTRGLAAEGNFFNGLLINDFISLDETRTRERISFGTRSNDLQGGLWDSAQAQVYWQESTAASDGIQQGSVSFGPFPTPRNRLNELEFLTRIVGLDASAEHLFFYNGITHALRYGIDLSQSNVEAKFLRTDFRPDGSFTQEDRIGMAPSEVNRIGLFVFNEIIFGRREEWSLFPGLRFDAYEVSPENTQAFLNRTLVQGTGQSIQAIEYRNNAFAPSLSLLYRFNDTLNAFASYGRGIRNPSAEELNGVFIHGTDFIVLPNPSLKEETADTFEVGLQASRAGLQGRSSIFFNRYSNFLQANTLLEEREGEPDILTTVNLSEVESYGFELSLRYRFDSDFLGQNGWETGTSFSWAKGNQTDIDQPLNSIDPARLVTFIGIAPGAQKWDFRLSGTFIDRKSESRLNQTTQAGPFDPVASVFLLDLQGGYQLTSNWSLSLSLNNLTDRSYFLWSTARRGGGHGGGGADRNTQPGINGSITLSASF